ncbi:RNA-binding domain-containing protein [Hesseltinella vesiculosa]|uniref:RNA-binding domain-containing protein n=1 Tax=Hesseltinella vesiculosa TaxID=101127 RepID=A0A1X2G753_9FUNG|nr:RNA-binding domain-containing protein [Hesseltinella vesiculosa]
MSDKLPPHLLRYFVPRPALKFTSPLDKPVQKRVGPIVSGIAQFVPLLQNYDPDYIPWKSKAEQKKEKAQQREQSTKERVEKGIADFAPDKNEQATGDPFHTLFVFNLSYEVDEEELKREFDEYGVVKTVRLIRNESGKSRGYAFIEYEREKDMRAAYKEADGRRFFGRRLEVDVERGRTVKNWRPRRLGGGLGHKRDLVKSSEPASNSTSARSSDRQERSSYNNSSSSSSRRGGSDRYGDRHKSRDYDDRRRYKRSRSRSPGRGYRDKYRGRDSRDGRGDRGDRGDRDRDRYGGGRRDRDRY